MPELPEVETVKRGLGKLIINKQILDVKIFNEKSLDASMTVINAKLVGAKVVGIRRRAKVLIIDLSSGYSLVIHLKMTGQLVYRVSEGWTLNGSSTKLDKKGSNPMQDKNWAAGHPTDSFIAKLPDKSTRVEFLLCDCHPGLDPGSRKTKQNTWILKQDPSASLGMTWSVQDDIKNASRLFFNDQRKFGWIKLLPTTEVENIDFLKKVGPEPLTGDPKLPEQFLKNIRRRNNTTIKAALLDQTIIAGIGNIYADESLWMASVHPIVRVRELSDEKLTEILKCAIEIMKKSIESGGSTMKTYLRADGTRGNYLEKFANVFRRDGKPCPRCKTTIKKMRTAGRGTHICPMCQKQK